MKLPSVVIWIAAFILSSSSAGAQPDSDSLEWATWGHPRNFLIRFQREAQDTTRLEGRFEVSYQGREVMDGQFEHSKKTGDWKFYHPENGLLAAEGNYVGGQPHGQWKYYRNDGNLKSVRHFYYGEPRRITTSYYAGGNPRAEVLYDASGRLQQLTYFYDNGDTALQRTINHEVTPLEVDHRSFYKRGPRFEEYSFRIAGDVTFSTDFSNPLSVYSLTDPEFDALLATDGVMLNGSFRRFHSSGYLWEHLYFVNDTLDACYASNNQWGTPQDRGDFRAGSGKLIRYHRDNDTARVEHYKNGLRHGEARYFKEGGQLLARGNFSQGKPEGEWRFYDRDGRVHETHHFIAPDTIEVSALRKSNFEDRKGRYVGLLKEGRWVYFDFYGDTASVENYRNGLRDGPYRSYLQGAIHQRGTYRENLPTRTWNTFNNQGRISWQDSLPDITSSGKFNTGSRYQLYFPLSSSFRFTPTLNTSQLLPLMEEPFVRIIDGRPHEVTMRAGRDDGEAVFALMVEATGHVVGLEMVRFNRPEFYYTGLFALQQIPYLSPATLEGVPIKSIQLISFYFTPL